MINVCQIVFGIGFIAFLGIIYIAIVEIASILKTNRIQINEKTLDDLLIKGNKNVSKNKKQNKKYE